MILDHSEATLPGGVLVRDGDVDCDDDGVVSENDGIDNGQCLRCRQKT